MYSRLIACAFALALAAAPALAQDAAPERRLTVEELTAFLKQSRMEKPGVSVASGNDSCRWANDMECDDPDIGTGACTMGTDYSDCRYLREGETDTCRWARDGECDEPGLGTGVCTQGTDSTDCAGIVHLRFQTDSCETAFNGQCEDRDSPLRNAPARCDGRTDRADCYGRERPMTINDHFQGYDDRQILHTDVYPWDLVGTVEFSDQSECTATLVAADVILTAAHCVHDDDDRLAPAGMFRTGFERFGGGRSARVTGVFVAPQYVPETFNNSNKVDGSDWALLRIDRPLGDEIGALEITELVEGDAVTLNQAGYSWDTGDHLSGHLDCELVAILIGNTFEHRCDSTRGDSGSPIMVEEDGVYRIVGVDSNFRDQPAGPPVNIAVHATAFSPYFADFVDGVIGTTVAGGKGP
ncbi:MAG: trypsin-like serine protease [Maricaulaceae bacterium]|jgi:protease YdgD